MSAPPGLPPAGWYPDPAGAPVWRWWDGRLWSTVTSDPVEVVTGSAGVGTGGAQPTARPAVEQETRSGPWAVRAVWAMGLSTAASAVLAVAYSSTTRREFDYLRRVLADGSRGATTTVPAPVQPGAELVANDLVAIVALAGLVLFLVWQFRAAVAGRALGIPARRSPGWGVGSWFVPVVNLWFPYQALRDTLPPGHRDRSLVVRMWGFHLASWVLSAGTFAAMLSRPAGAVLAAASVVTAVGFAITAARVVSTVGDEHRRAAADLW